MYPFRKKRLLKCHMGRCHVPFQGEKVTAMSHGALSCSLLGRRGNYNVTWAAAMYPFRKKRLLKCHMGCCHVPFQGEKVTQMSHGALQCTLSGRKSHCNVI